MLGKCLLPGHDPDRTVLSPLGIHTWASIRVFAESLFFQTILVPTGVSMKELL